MSTRVDRCGSFAAALLLTMLLSVTGAAAQPTEVRTSTFDTDLEGWTCHSPTHCEHRSTGGNPGGYLRFTHRWNSVYHWVRICDNDGDPARSLFTGDLSSFKNGTVLFDVVVFGAAPNPWEGSSDIHFFDTSFPAIGGAAKPIGSAWPTSWTTYAVPLSAGSWKRINSSGELLSDSLLTFALSDVECWFVDVGDELNFYETGLETVRTGFDNFTLISYPDPAVADFTWTPSQPEVGFPVQFVDLSTGEGLDWRWDFDDDGVTDSTAQNPTKTFAAPGRYRVSLTAENSVREHTIHRDVSIHGSGVAVTLADWQYDGFFLEGTDVNNDLDIEVAWQGPVGNVTFSIDGATPIEEPGDVTGASHTFNLATDFAPDFTPSLVTVTPKNGDDVVGQVWTEKVYVFPFPRWLDIALSSSSDAVTLSVGDGEIKTDLKADFPHKHLCRPSGPPCKLTIPEFVPYLSGEWGMEETYARLTGTLSSKGTGTIGLTGQSGIKALDQILEGEVEGIGTWAIGPPAGFELDEATFKLGLKGTIRKELGVIEAIPALAPYAGLRLIRWFNDRAKIVGDISPFVELTTTIKQENGDLRFEEFTNEVGIELKATVKVDVVPKRVTAQAWVSGGGSLTVGVPEPFLRKLKLHIEAGAEYEVDAIFIVKEGEFRCRATCQWTPSTGITCPIDCDVEAGRLPTVEPGATITLRPMVYEEFGLQDRLVFTEVPAVPTRAGLPISGEQSVLFSNVFAGASPEIVHAGSGALLLWEHQDAGDPVTQSSEIGWSWFDFTSWSAMSLVADDTRMELSPVAATDANGKVAAAWLRIKDPAFTTPILTEADLPLFYNELEVVTSVFDPAGQTWGPVTALTDDSTMDTDLRLASDPSGNLLLTWLSNPGGEFISTASSPSVLVYSLWDAGSQTWSAPAAIATGLVGAVRHTSAIRGSQALVVVSRDPDPDVTDDGELDLYTWNGVSWSTATQFAGGGGLENRSPSAAYDATGEGHVVWLQGADMVHATLSAPTPQVIRTGSDTMGLHDFQLVVNDNWSLLTVIWRAVDDNQPSDLVAMTYDRAAQIWGGEQRLTDDADLRNEDFSAAYDSSGQLYLAYLATHIDRIEQQVTIEGQPTTLTNIPQDGQVDLRLIRKSAGRDLAIVAGDIVAAPTFPLPGETVDVDATVHNSGDLAVGDFDVDLYVGNPQIGGTLIDTGLVVGPFAPADERTLQFSFVMPAPADDIYVVVDPDDFINEKNDSNNQGVYRIANAPPDPVLLADVTSGTPPLTVQLDGRASTDPDFDALTFGWSFGDGSPSETGGVVTHTFDRPGDFPVTLAVRDARGAVSSQTTLIRVGGGAGAIPDGGWVAGVPLQLAKAGGGDLTLSWSVTPCGLGDTDYAIYEGTLGDFESHTPTICDVGGVGMTSATVTPSSADSYYLVVPHNGSWEGSYGRRMGGYERPASAAACHPRGIGTCEPCGNGTVDLDEPCDGSDLAGATCESLGFAGGTLACNSTCTELDTLGCYSSGCGNGVIDGTETCDGLDVGSSDCSTAGFDSGFLACNAGCDGLDTSGCYACGNSVCEPANGEDCISCPADCNGVQGGNPANRYCCGDSGGEGPVPCSDPRCTASGNTCLDCVASATLPTTGLVLRLEPDVGLQTTGGEVTGWQDSSGSDNDLTAFGGPILDVGGLNGRDFVSFDGVDDKLERSATLNALPAGNTDRAMFYVVRYHGNGFGGLAFGSQLCDGAFGLVVDPVGNLAVQGWCNDLVAAVSGNGAGWMVQSAVLSSGVVRHYKDGDIIDTRTHTFDTGADKLVLGAELDGSPFVPMDVGAVLLYDRALGDLERRQVESYLQQRYLGSSCP